MALRSDQQGQAFTEYILLISIVLLFFMIISSGISKWRIGDKLTQSLTQSFAAVYRYGDVRAKGFDDGGPIYHPRAESGQNNFRIFLKTKIN